ncbi:MAG: 2-oxoacid:ferredoxin oxidoreductase subunit beta [Bradymonadales bacterium]|nr:2-oxoacid:ferredoxin oxidoreductase subunit beta [Bradymonadales bacterium]
MNDELHPLGSILRMERLPHIWCPGCGIGTAVNTFARAVLESQMDLDKLSIVSGIGCSGRVAGYVRLDSFHTTHGRAIPFATGLKLANPELTVVVFSGDGDLFSIGGNHFIHAARRNVDLLVICINNLTYAMTGGQIAPTSPPPSIQSTSPYGAFEQPFNLPFLADSCGATYVARWTTFHVMQLKKSILQAFKQKGFRFIEVLSSCPTLYERRNRLGDGLDRMRFYKERSVIKKGCDTREVDLHYQDQIIVGRFVDRNRETWLEAMNRQHAKALGNAYREYRGTPWA